MKYVRSKHLLTTALFSLGLLVFPAFHASAQQIDYYTFDAPGNNSNQYSWNCNAPLPPGTPAPLFCLNNPQTSNAYPFFAEDPNIPDPAFPPSLPITQGGQWVLQTTNAGGQAASMWFAVPQFVDQGFNAWFQFRITPISGSPTTGDGFAFVIQNSQGGGSVSIPTGSTPPSNLVCTEAGSGWTAVGGGGGCLGYGGIDNSLALEFDTYQDNWDPNGNHIALQSCGTNGSFTDSGPANSPVHYTTEYGDTSCLVTLGTGLTAVSTLVSNPMSSGVPNSNKPPASVTLADGALHQVLMVYNGPADSPPNTLTVYLDPTFASGTLTPVANSQAVFTGPFDITQYVGLFGAEGSPSGNFPAWVGFTAATGSAFEQHEITGWTFTPHTQVQQSQPVNAPTSSSPATTTFDFGTHSYSVTLPAGTDVPTGTTMTVIATPIPESTFAALIGGSFTGSQCQEYDDTGTTNGTPNCIVYNVSCNDSTGSVYCPAPSGAPQDCAANPGNPNCLVFTTYYNNSFQPTSAGFLQGDPFYAPVSQIDYGNTNTGTTGNIQCVGECAGQGDLTVGQTINLVNPTGGGPGLPTVVAQLMVTNVDGPNSFDFTSTIPVTGGEINGTLFLTSTNVQNIIIPGGYQENPSDGSTTGTGNKFSDFIATSVTPAFIGTQTVLTATNNPATENQSDLLTATITVTNPAVVPASGAGSMAGGTVTFYTGSTPPLTPVCSGVALTQTQTSPTPTYTATCSYEPTSTSSVPLSAVYTGDPYYQTGTGTLTLPVNPNTHELSVTAGTGGTVSINNGPASTSVQAPEIPLSTPTITATPNPGYYFSSWTGSNDITNSTSASTTVTMKGPENITAIFTAKATPTITWAPPSIELGYPLGAAQLDATAIPSGGTFMYSPPAGTIISSPAAGQMLSVTYTPSDTVHYTTATKTVPLTVTPGPLVSLSPSNGINFGTLYLGQIVTKTVTVTNTGNAALAVNDPLVAILPGNTVGNLSEFVTVNLCPKSLAAGKSCTMTVTFIAGPFYTPQSATLSITDSAYGSPQHVALSATVIDPVPQFSATSLSFGTVDNPKTSAKTITLTSAGGTPLSLTSIAVTGTGFTQTNTCTVPSPPNQGMNPKSSCTITVTFAPSKTAKGTQTGALVVTDNAFISTQSIPLSGTAN